MIQDTGGPIMGMHWEPSRRITDREWRVWGLVAAGMGNKEIGENLEYADKTINNIIVALYTKLSVPDGSGRRVKLALMYPRRSD